MTSLANFYTSPLISPRAIAARALTLAALLALPTAHASEHLPPSVPGETWSVAMKLSVVDSKGFAPEQLLHLRSTLAAKAAPETFCSGADFLTSMASDLAENCAHARFDRAADGSAKLSGLCSGQQLSIAIAPTPSGYAGTVSIETADAKFGPSARLEGAYEAERKRGECRRLPPKTR